MTSDVGAGSVVVGQISAAIADTSDENKFSAASSLTFENLVQDKLNAVTAADLTRLNTENGTSHAKYLVSLKKWKAFNARLTAAQIKTGQVVGASDGVQRFIGAWNQYLAKELVQTTAFQRDLQLGGQIFADTDVLVKADQTALRTKSESAVTAARATLVKHLTGFAKSVKTEAHGDVPLTDLIQVVNTNSDAQAFLESVNKKYPQGELAQIKKK